MIPFGTATVWIVHTCMETWVQFRLNKRRVPCTLTQADVVAYRSDVHLFGNNFRSPICCCDRCAPTAATYQAIEWSSEIVCQLGFGGQCICNMWMSYNGQQSTVVAVRHNMRNVIIFTKIQVEEKRHNAPIK